MAKSYAEEVARFADFLAALIRSSGRTRQGVEQHLEMSSGYLSKILSGVVELRMRHVFMVLDALGLQPADVFPLTYRPEPRSEIQQAKARRLLDTVLESYGQAPTTPQPQPETDADFDERVRLALARMLGLKLPEPG